VIGAFVVSDCLLEVINAFLRSFQKPAGASPDS
jgi:hypothetical protein